LINYNPGDSVVSRKYPHEVEDDINGILALIAYMPKAEIQSPNEGWRPFFK
jgi:hypothetical protein